MDGIEQIDSKALLARGMATVRYGIADEELKVKFYKKALENTTQTLLANRPIFDSFDFIRIDVPGGKLVVDRKVKAEDKDRFSRQWDLYQKGDEVQIVGTPIEQWPLLSVDRVETYKALKLYSVEQIAAASDRTLSDMGMGAREIQQKAREFLDSAAQAAPHQEMREENEKLKNELKELTEKVSLLIAVKTKKKKEPE